MLGPSTGRIAPTPRPARRAAHAAIAAGALMLIAFAAGVPLFSPAAAATVLATRVWPAREYTRLTFESVEPLKHKLFTLENPQRLVLDLEDIEPSPALASFAEHFDRSGPYVKSVRVGRFRAGVLRLVFDLKTRVKPQIFALAPVGEYRHRLVLDLYPETPVDPLMALLERPSDMPADGAEATESGDRAPLASPPTEAPSSTPPSIASPSDLPLFIPPAAVAKLKSVPPGNRRLVIVVIDPGHGGEDPGALGRGGAQEKDVTLAIARKLKERIDREPNMKAVLTRDGDYFIPLHVRVQKARAVNADLFVSVHADSFIQANARGSSVFALSESGATSAAARLLAKHENAADLIGGVNMNIADPYLKQTLLDLSQTATINDSLKLGRAVLGELGGVNALHKAQVEQAGFAVLKAPDIPSILVETAFISNPEEERRLTDSDYQYRMADAVVGGIRRYFAANPPLARAHLVRNP